MTGGQDPGTEKREAEQQSEGGDAVSEGGDAAWYQPESGAPGPREAPADGANDRDPRDDI